MKLKKILLRALLAIFLLLVLVLCAAPYILYKKQKAIVSQVVGELNKTFKGHFSVGDSYISPFRQFPYISVDLKNVRFFASKDTSEKPLYEVADFYVGFNIKSILSGNYEVKRLHIENGHLNLVQHPDGSLNLLLAKGMDGNKSTADTSAFHFGLKAVTLKDMDVTYLNEKDSLLFESYFSSAKASFSMKEPQLNAEFDGDMEWNLVQNGDTSFFKHKKISLSTKIAIDQSTQQVSIAPSTLNMDGGVFGFSGKADLDNDLFTDITLQGNKPDFNLILAFAPENIRELFRPYANQGKVFFDAQLKGHLAPGKKYALTANFGCDQGYFLNTVSDKKLEDLAFKGSFSNGKDSTWASAELKVENMYAKPGTGIFQGDLTIQNFSDPHIAAKLHSDLNLQFLQAFLGLEALEGMKGQVLLDMDFNELVDFAQPENSLVQLKKGIDSELRIRDFSFNMKGNRHPVEKLNLHAQMRNGRVEVDTFHCKMGASDIALSGFLSDLPAIFHHQEKPIEMGLLVQSKLLRLNELLAGDSSSPASKEEISNFSAKMAFKTSVANLTNSSGIPKGEFFIEDFFARLKHYPHTFHDFHADILINDSILQLKDFTGQIDTSDFHFSGKLSNYPLWLKDEKNGRTRFEFDLRSDLIKLENLFSYNGENYVPEDYRHEELRELHLKGAAAIQYNKTFQGAFLVFNKAEAKLKVHPMKFEDFQGRVVYAKQRLRVRDFYGKMGKSDLRANIDWYLGEDSLLMKEHNKITLTSDFLDVDALMNYKEPTKPVQHDSAFNIFQLPFTYAKLDADIKKLNHHKIWLKDLKATLRMQPNHYLYVDTFAMKLTGGQFAAKGYFNGSDPTHIYFKSTISVNNLDLDKALFRFDNFGQDYQLNKNLHGMLSGTVKSTFLMHPDLVPILEKSEAELDISVTDGSLVDFAPMQAMSAYFKDKNLRMVRFDTLKNTLHLKDATLHIPLMNINSSLGFLEIGGKQSLDMNMEYLVRVPLKLVTQVGWRALFGGRKKEEVDPEQEDAIVYRDMDKKMAFLSVRITGNPDDYKVTLGKK